MKYFAATAFSISLWAATSAHSLDLYHDALPQAQTNTCQSYASVLALAAANDPAFSVDTFSELRTLEANFRSILESMDNADPYSHANWPAAMSQLTGGAYTFEIQYVPDLLDWLSMVQSHTTLSDDIDGLIATVTGGRIETVLTSVTSLDGSSYATGHIVTVMAVLGSGIDSTTELMVFNSALKGQGGTVNQCAPGNQPGDERYQAGIVESDSFQLRDWGSGMLLMKLVKN